MTLGGIALIGGIVAFALAAVFLGRAREFAKEPSTRRFVRREWVAAGICLMVIVVAVVVYAAGL